MSPGIQTLLSKEIANVNNKKTINFSSYQIPNFDTDHLAEVFQRSITQRVTKHEKKNPIPRLTLLPKKKTNTMLRHALSKVDEIDRYKYLDEGMINKFSEFFAVKNILNQNGQARFPANEKIHEFQILANNKTGTATDLESMSKLHYWDQISKSKRFITFYIKTYFLST